MSEPPEIWFERVEFGLGAYYAPTTNKGLLVVIGHFCAIFALLTPVALLAQFKVIGGAIALILGLLPTGLVFLRLLRVMHRHSAPVQLGGDR